uniref:Uncharacterized protein n=1 Tax=Salix viminalis TaxID=40686 RepID=A0A6N2N7K4_SALVM
MASHLYLSKVLDVSIRCSGSCSLFSQRSLKEKTIGKFGFQCEVVAGVLTATCGIQRYRSFSPKQISHSSCPYNSVVFQMLAHEHAMVSSKGLRMLLAKGNINNMHGAALVRLS